MRLWHHVSQAILAQDPLTTSFSGAATTTPSISLSTTLPSNPIVPIMATPQTNYTTNTTLYFGYGSNLWRQQMHNRCPNSTYLGIARLNNYKWIINERGYANVVEVDTKRPARQNAVDHTSLTTHEEKMKWSNRNYSTQVWGLVYSLQPRDEARLDRNEGVPFAYTKEMLECDFWPVDNDRHDERPAPSMRVTGKKPEIVDMLVYINRDAVTPSEPKEEYVYRMNMGIRDAVKAGVPEGYVEEVMRKFIPEIKDEGEVVEVAEKQALEFENER
jgi:hypothetical protein